MSLCIRKDRDSQRQRLSDVLSVHFVSVSVSKAPPKCVCVGVKGGERGGVHLPVH